jgi:hypothetical protein
MLSMYLLEKKKTIRSIESIRNDLHAIEELSFCGTVLSFHISSSNLTARSTDCSSDYKGELLKKCFGKISFTNFYMFFNFIKISKFCPFIFIYL